MDWGLDGDHQVKDAPDRRQLCNQIDGEKVENVSLPHFAQISLAYAPCT